MRSAVAYFDDEARRYDRRYDGSGAHGYALRTRLQAVSGALGRGPGTVLDAGMGGGRLCAELAEQGWDPSGIDAADGMVAIARARLPHLADRLVVGRLEALPFASGSFDAVVATGSLEYSSVPDALAEIARVLRPGGRAVLTYPNPYALYALWKTRVYYTLVRGAKRLARHPHPDLPRGFGVIPPKAFATLLAGHGFDVQAVGYTSYKPLLTPFDNALPRLAAALAEPLERRRIAPGLFSTQVVYTATRLGG